MLQREGGEYFRSWQSFEFCVIVRFTGIQVKEITSYVPWKDFGNAIQEKRWANMLSLLKSGINTYLRRDGMRAGAKFALKQILNASGVGLPHKQARALLTVQHEKDGDGSGGHKLPMMGEKRSLFSPITPISKVLDVSRVSPPSP